MTPEELSKFAQQELEKLLWPELKIPSERNCVTTLSELIHRTLPNQVEVVDVRAGHEPGTIAFKLRGPAHLMRMLFGDDPELKPVGE